ncbi:glutamate racemase [Longimicrobium sp.]|uniref:glutamate racemase n=1 Tax=Longimicrobium sp. TaxID=2029185 RepID=UPI002CE3F1D2|nr:glutamate racemase [Longimicrobium sp.]HSU14794.1 glutamate racemase [Longimicrobium sp.]
MSGPVGIFDSGIGGLSVAREIRQLLPAEHLLYVADSAFVPYGDRTVDEVRARTLAAGRWLQAQGARILVVACNTASGAALELLRERLSIPVVGLEPAVKPAVAASRNGRVGVMATVGTLRSERYARLVANYANGSQVISQPCPGLADLIEDGHLDDEVLHARMAEYAAPLKEAGVDTVVLGCTHYPFVREQIAAALGPDVRIVESGPAIARQTERVLREAGELEPGGAGSLRILTTGDPAEVGAVAARIWGEPLPVQHLDLVHEPAISEVR